eukprot:3136993-Rhodomonas_salina.1
MCLCVCCTFASTDLAEWYYQGYGSLSERDAEFVPGKLHQLAALFLCATLMGGTALPGRGQEAISYHVRNSAP